MNYGTDFENVTLKLVIVISLFAMLSGIATAYDPQASYNYAQRYWNTPASDGYFWNTPSGYIQISAGTNIVGRTGYDCAHFVSSAIGNEQHEIGGGLIVPSRVPPTYGEPSATNLGNWLINNNLGIEVSDVLQLEKGDVIIYDWEKDGQWDHITLYLGGGLIASHTSFLWNSDWKMGDLDANHRFIHIKGNPTNEWEFNTPGIKEGWFVHNILSWSVESDGMFRIDPNINDPYIESTLQWKYIKDRATIAGSDAGWVDRVEFVPT
jgi:hypothetical protein